MPVKTIDQRVAFIGAGNMAEALARGLLRAAVSRPELLTVSDLDAGRRAHFQKTYSVAAAADNAAAVRAAEVVVLAVKPQALPGVLAEIRDALTPRHLVISIAAGVTLRRLAETLGAQTRLVRAMPNMPALVGAGATVFCRGAQATAADAELARRLFAAAGLALEMDERHLNAVTALSGSGPAYVFYLAEALARAGADLGLPAAAAAQLAAATVDGAGRMLRETGAPPEELRARVTSRGGTTAAAMQVLEEREFLPAVNAALAAACRRAAELAQ